MHLHWVTGGVEEGRRRKTIRAPAIRDIDIVPDQALDERNGPLESQQSSVPPGFLSPSVKEYLELGKSIPGIVLELSCTRK